MEDKNDISWIERLRLDLEWAGIDRSTASLEAARAAFRRMRKANHPDANHGSRAGEGRFARAQKALDLLGSLEREGRAAQAIEEAMGFAEPTARPFHFEAFGAAKGPKSKAERGRTPREARGGGPAEQTGDASPPANKVDPLGSWAAKTAAELARAADPKDWARAFARACAKDVPNPEAAASKIAKAALESRPSLGAPAVFEAAGELLARGFPKLAKAFALAALELPHAPARPGPDPSLHEAQAAWSILEGHPRPERCFESPSFLRCVRAFGEALPGRVSQLGLAAKAAALGALRPIGDGWEEAFQGASPLEVEALMARLDPLSRKAWSCHAEKKQARTSAQEPGWLLAVKQAALSPLSMAQRAYEPERAASMACFRAAFEGDWEAFARLIDDRSSEPQLLGRSISECLQATGGGSTQALARMLEALESKRVDWKNTRQPGVQPG